MDLKCCICFAPPFNGRFIDVFCLGYVAYVVYFFPGWLCTCMNIYCMLVLKNLRRHFFQRFVFNNVIVFFILLVAYA